MEMSQMYGTVEDDCVQNNEGIENQQKTPSAESQVIDRGNQLENFEPEMIQNSEESGRDIVPVETGLTCSCESASQPNLPDVILNDCNNLDKTKNDSEV